MTKEEILQKHFNYGFTGMESNAIFKAMDEYAKRVLDFILNASEDGIGGDPKVRIEMVGRNFFYETDKEGDHELDAEKIIALYEFLQRRNENE